MQGYEDDHDSDAQLGHCHIRGNGGKNRAVATTAVVPTASGGHDHYGSDIGKDSPLIAATSLAASAYY